MAKRRKIAAPSAEDISRIEEEFRRETLTRPNAGMAPISQVVAETAQARSVEAPAAQVRKARDSLDAQSYREAEADGRVILALATESIQADVLVRDRTVIDPEEMAELKTSVSDHGVRLPIEVFARSDAQAAYGLLSGYRRLCAVRELYRETGETRFASIPALVRDPEALGGGFAAMVEENEIRSSLSHFERGRIAVVAAQRGAFPSTEAAVDHLFRSASKAKRSKIRSFALIFEELGDLLSYAEALKERDGLRLATALRNGATAMVRAALEQAHADAPETEWAAVATAVARSEKVPDGPKPGRPRRAPAREVLSESVLGENLTLIGEIDGGDFLIRLRGGRADSETLEKALAAVQDALG